MFSIGIYITANIVQYLYVYATRGDNPATPEALFVADFREFCLCYLQYEIEHFLFCRKFVKCFFQLINDDKKKKNCI